MKWLESTDKNTIIKWLHDTLRVFNCLEPSLGSHKYISLCPAYFASKIRLYPHHAATAKLIIAKELFFRALSIPKYRFKAKKTNQKNNMVLSSSTGKLNPKNYVSRALIHFS